MSVSEILTIMIGSIAEIIVFSIYMSQVCEARFNKFVFPLLLMLFALPLPLIFKNSYSSLGLIRSIINIFIVAASVIICFKDRMRYKLLCFAAVYLSNTIVISVVILVFKLLGWDLSVFYTAGGIGSLAFRAFITVFQTISAFGLIMLIKRNISESAKTTYYFISAVSVYYFIMLYMSYISSYYHIDMFNLLFILITAMLVSMLFIFLAFRAMKKQHENDIIEALHKEQYKYLTEQYEALQKNYLELRKLRHDFKDQILVIESLAQNSDTAKLHDYISEVQNDLSKTDNVVFCKNSVFNIILASKYQIAKGSGINMNISVREIDGLDISEIYLCRILSNILQNAVENTVPNGNIDFDMFIRADQLVIVCKNDTETDNATFETTKDDKESHGYGLKIINDLIAQLNGNCILDNVNNRFSIIVNIPLGGKKV